MDTSTTNETNENAVLVAERARAEWAANPAVRSEFASEADFVAFRKAEARGLARIFGAAPPPPR